MRSIVPLFIALALVACSSPDAGGGGGGGHPGGHGGTGGDGGKAGAGGGGSGGIGGSAASGGTGGGGTGGEAGGAGAGGVGGSAGSGGVGGIGGESGAGGGAAGNGGAAGSGGMGGIGGIGGEGGIGGQGGVGGAGGALPIGLDARPSNPTCTALPPAVTTAWATERIYPALSFNNPIFLTQAPGVDTWAYVVEQAGRIRRFDVTNPTSASTVLDITSQVTCCDERGLLGLAFHPDFAQNGEAFISYTTTIGSELWSRVSRIHSSNGGASFDPASEEIILSVRQPFANHNGGMIAFGPDGYLYIGFGDGGSGGDPQGNGQNTGTLLGKILRIDPDGGVPYAIPPSNPFAGSTTAREEIFAIGLRNPWRFSFDRLTGDLWVGDVGQDTLEEIDLVVPGGNYGWSAMEGTNCYNTNPCAGLGFIDPVLTYPRSEGQSVTGGYVYRGTQHPDLYGAYIFGDYVSGRIWKATQDASGTWTKTLLVDANFNIPSFAEMNDGEIVILDYWGRLHRLVPTAASGPPPLLSQTGCFDPADPTVPAQGLLPFDVNVPFWSDGADKKRWLAIPDGTSITIDSDGHLVFPPGSVLVKEFTEGTTRIETRFLSRDASGSWSGVSYAWRADQTDAEVVPLGDVRSVAGKTWIFPSAGACSQCHVSVAGDALGTEVLQLNREIVYPATGRVGHQLATLAAVGMLTLPIDPREYPALPSDPSAPLDLRARAWLHANCAFCHRPGGPGLGAPDFRWNASTPNVCDVVPLRGDFGLVDARIVAPGHPERSVLLHRISVRNAPGQMPPLATNLVDTAGVSLLDAWIQSLSTCP